MKTLYSEINLIVPEGVTIDIKSKKVVVTGPFGKLEKDYSRFPVDMKKVGENNVKLEMWYADRKTKAQLRTVASLISNLFTGVTRKYQYKMRLVYAHFPINANIVRDGKGIEIRNFLGEKVVRRIDMLGDVVIYKGADVKDELVLEGIDVEQVSRCAALIHQSTLVKNKDIRKFLDGIYISHRGVVVQDD